MGLTTKKRKERATQRSFGAMDIHRLRDRHTVEALTPYQFRINGTLDVYPTSRRFHCLRTQERGTYNDLGLLVQAHFG